MWFRTLLIFLFVYLLIRGVLSFFKIRKVIKDQREMVQNQARKSTKPEGEVEVISPGNKSSNSSGRAAEDGDYVDYEELD